MFTLDLPTILNYACPGKAWAIKDDFKSYGNIQWLDNPADKPLLEDLQAAELPAAKALRISRSKQEAQDRIYATYPIWKQANAAMGLYDATENQAVKDGVQAIRTAQATAETAINALTSVTDVLAFTW